VNVYQEKFTPALGKKLGLLSQQEFPITFQWNKF